MQSAKSIGQYPLELAVLRFFTIAATFPVIQVFDTHKKGRKGKDKIRGFGRNLGESFEKANSTFDFLFVRSTEPACSFATV
jgi:hypothetical protein